MVPKVVEPLKFACIQIHTDPAKIKSDQILLLNTRHVYLSDGIVRENERSVPESHTCTIDMFRPSSSGRNKPRNGHIVEIKNVMVQVDTNSLYDNFVTTICQ